jgi:tRNA threonylcarbamoyladenosine biosynthesis protein TsaB
VRIAVGVTQGIAFGADLPVVPVSTLATVAQGVETDKVLVALDARMNEVYWGAYQRNSAGLMELLGEESVSSPDAVTLPDGEGWLGAGDGWAAYTDALMSRCAGQIIGKEVACFPHAVDVAVLGMAGFEAGQIVAAEHALPVYLRDKVTWKKIR